MSDSIITVRDLRKTFNGATAVDGVSFDVRRGEIFSLLGPNGAGKTTTISMLSCLLRPSGGDAAIDGCSILSDSLGVKRAIGVVPQELALYQSLTARHNLQFWGRLYGMEGGELKRRTAELLEQVGLSDRADHRVETFSGGMKRRLNIAVGLLHKPQLVFMDEPTVGIDPQSRRRILDMVKELQGQGMTVLYTTHYMEEAEELSNRVGIMDHGRLIAVGAQSELTQLVGEQETLRLHLDEAAEPDAVLIAELEAQAEILAAAVTPGEVTLTVHDAASALPIAMTILGRSNRRVRSIDITEPNLEAVFLHLTGRALRD